MKKNIFIFFFSFSLVALTYQVNATWYGNTAINYSTNGLNWCTSDGDTTGGTLWNFPSDVAVTDNGSLIPNPVYNSYGYGSNQTNARPRASVGTMYCIKWDASNPTGSVTLTNGWYNSNVTISFTASDAGGSHLSSIYLEESISNVDDNGNILGWGLWNNVVSINGAGSNSYNGNYVINFANKTAHKFRVVVYDIAGNTSTSSEYGYIKMENNLPSGGWITYSLNAGTTIGSAYTINGWTNQNETISFGIGADTGGSRLNRVELLESSASIDPNTGVVGAFGGYNTMVNSIPSNINTNGPSSTSWTRTPVDNKAYKYQIKVYDNAGNLYTYQSPNMIKFDTTPPTNNNILITGRIHIPNVDGHHNNGGDTDSFLYTFTPIIKLSLRTDGGASANDSMQFACTNSWVSVPVENNPYADGINFNITNFNITSRPGCNPNRGTKTIYVRYKDYAGNYVVLSDTIIYDDTPSSFIYPNLILKATDSYTYFVESANDDTLNIGPSNISGLNVYSFTFTVEDGTIVNQLNNLSNSINLSTYTKIINTHDSNNDGKISTALKISVFDRAGNIITHGPFNIDIIANDINYNNSKLVLSKNDNLNPTTSSSSGILADNSALYNYSGSIVDVRGNIVRPIENIRKIKMNFNFTNQVRFLNNNKGAIYYSYDNQFGTANIQTIFQGDNIINNNTTSIYSQTGGSLFRKANGIYNIDVRSLVPTPESGYPYAENKSIQLSNLIFTNTAETCMSGYRCSGYNTWTPNWNAHSEDLASKQDLVSGSSINLIKLKFWPALEVQMTKNWNTLTDNTWMPIHLTFKNNTSNIYGQDFKLNRFSMNFHYSNSNPFSDSFMRGNLFNSDKPGYPYYFNDAFRFESDSSQSFTVPKNMSIAKNIDFKGNSYGIGFGDLGFTSYIPHYINENYIWTSPNATSYNTANLGIDPSILGSEVDTSLIDTTNFIGDNNSVVHSVDITGNIGNSSNNRIGNVNTGVTSKSNVIDLSAISKYDFKTNIKQNVADLTRKLQPTGIFSATITSISNEIMYYDFTNCTASSINGNTGCNLILNGTNPTFDSTVKKIGITGPKTIIVKGGNVYLKSDLYYTNNNSLLGIVILRNETTKSKGGNLYIDPKVTNVVGSLFAEGSILSYESPHGVYSNGNTLEGQLTRQLYWFGSAYSSNSIGGSMVQSNWECPYGSDDNIAAGQNCTYENASKYDLALLRRFTLINPDPLGPCTGAGSNDTPKSLNNENIKYAWAGKKACRNSDPKDSDLLGTTKLSPIIFEYNPNIQHIKLNAFKN